MGLAFDDASDGSGCTVIRDLEGNFHIIAQDWSPINASTHAWDSPLEIHGISADGIGSIKIVNLLSMNRRNPQESLKSMLILIGIKRLLRGSEEEL